MRSHLIAVATLLLSSCSTPGANALGWTTEDIATEAAACKATHRQILDDARQAVKSGDLGAILAPGMNRSQEMLDGGCECQAAAFAREVPLAALRDHARDVDHGAVRARLALACLPAAR